MKLVLALKVCIVRRLKRIYIFRSNLIYVSRGNKIGFPFDNYAQLESALQTVMTKWATLKIEKPITYLAGTCHNKLNITLYPSGVPLSLHYFENYIVVF